MRARLARSLASTRRYTAVLTISVTRARFGILRDWDHKLVETLAETVDDVLCELLRANLPLNNRRTQDREEQERVQPRLVLQNSNLVEVALVEHFGVGFSDNGACPDQVRPILHH